MRKLLSTKYVNEVMIALVVVTVLAVIASATMMVSSTKKLTAAYSEAAAVPVKVPLLSMRSEPYSQESYKVIQQGITFEFPVKVDALPDKLVISSPDIGGESQWRRAVSDALALDRNLHSSRVCGSVANACSGAALVAELVGVRQFILIKE